MRRGKSPIGCRCKKGDEEEEEFDRLQMQRMFLDEMKVDGSQIHALENREKILCTDVLETLERLKSRQMS